MQQVRTYRLLDTGEVEANAAADAVEDAAAAGPSGSGAPGPTSGAVLPEVPNEQVKTAYRVRW